MRPNSGVQGSSADLFVAGEPPELAWGFYVTASGRKKLKWPARGGTKDFEEGMAKRLHNKWPDLYGHDAHGDGPFDAIIMCAASEATAANAALMALLSRTKGFDEVARYEGFTGSEGRDPFGFIDGISQPRFVEPIEWTKERAKAHSIKTPITKINEARVQEWIRSCMPLNTILVGEPGVPKPETSYEFGSYLVFQRFSINADAFPRAAGKANNIMGRRKDDGTPLIRSPQYADASNNDFDFEGDPQGKRCPFDAHIRKMNPRNGNQARITRRGFRTKYGDGTDGLLFMCWQASIVEQYERLLSWGHGPFDGGPDALFGTPGQFVNNLGGEYLYAPSVPRLLKP